MQKQTPVLKLAAIFFIVFGILTPATNISFRVMHWPNDMFQGHITGPALVVLGIVFLIVHLRKAKNRMHSWANL